ncbi:DUF5659 domain-containing protein [Rossellomorea marisflavi]|uniref:DUF5659 domain-containing protein n=1 Tax=Rossellomorea marisflavi TaxID=189381 RepID=UPI00345D05D9
MKNIKYQEKDLFYCYSLNLFHFLKANGFYYIFKDRRSDTNLYYWVFHKTPEIMGALTQFTRSNKKYIH